MKNKKTIITSIILLLMLAITGSIIYYFAMNKDENNLTGLDKQWIEKNKNNVIDFSIINDIPVYNNDGEGILLDFMTLLVLNLINYLII